MSKLDPYEKEILEAFESGKLKKYKTEKQQLKRHAPPEVKHEIHGCGFIFKKTFKVSLSMRQFTT